MRDELIKFGSRHPSLRPEVRRRLARIKVQIEDPSEGSDEDSIVENFQSSVHAGHAGQVAKALSNLLKEPPIEQVEESTSQSNLGSIMIRGPGSDGEKRDVMISVEKQEEGETGGTNAKHVYEVIFAFYKGIADESEVEKKLEMTLSESL